MMHMLFNKSDALTVHDYTYSSTCTTTDMTAPAQTCLFMYSGHLDYAVNEKCNVLTIFIVFLNVKLPGSI